MTKRILPSLLALLMCIAATSARAATVTVTGTGDTVAVDGVVTLREAIQSINSFGDANADVMAYRTGTYGSDTIVFDPTAFNAPKTITVGSTLTMDRDAVIQGPASRITVSGNSTYNVFSVNEEVQAEFTTLTIANGLYGIENDGVVYATGCNLSDNQYGIVNHRELHVTTSTIQNSLGGIFNSTDGIADIQSSTLNNNSQFALSGGRSTNFTNCTISGNGIGINSTSGFTTVNSTTVNGNTTGLSNTGSSVSLQNSLVVGNSTNVSGAFTDWGGNRTVGNTADAKLGPLRDNGGPTQTIALLAGSPAIDTGVPGGVSDQVPTTDQRGEPRPQGAGIDIGAYERAPQNLTGFVVTTTEDAADGDLSLNDISLREAITSANANPDENIITFDPQLFNTARTISVASALPPLAHNATIQGPGSDLTIDGGDDSFFIFAVNSGVTASFNRLTIINGLNAINITGDVSVTDCTLRDNSNGAGIMQNGRGTFTKCTSNNNGVGIGSSGTASITNCTLADNTYNGIISFFGPISVLNTTITNSGTGIQTNSNSYVTLKNTLVVGNATNTASGTNSGIIDEGGNRTTGTAKSAGLDPRGLRDNGGPTKTIALNSGSPAINAGVSSYAPATDQRGVYRPQGAGIDIGAFETIGSLNNAGLVVTITGDADNGNYDPNDISLREAINYANSNSDVSTITFAIPGDGAHTIQLASALPDLSTSINFNGPGEESVTIDGGGDYRIFNILTNVTIGLSNLTLASGRELTGGAVFNEGTFNAGNSTFSGNSANAGGAIYNSYGTANFTNCTFSENSTPTGGNFNNGGALFNRFGILSLSSSTVSANSASVNGGGIFNNNGAANLTLKNTILAGNTGAANPNLDGDYTDGGGNFIGGDPKLGDLANNGGPTATMLPEDDSPVVDAGTSTDAPSADQRGVYRPQGAGIDIGAVELETNPNTLPVVADISVSTIKNTEYTFSASIFDGGYTDVDNDELAKVKITSLPSSGALKLGTDEVIVDQEIDRDDLDDLAYSPIVDFTGDDSFAYTASDGSAYAAEEANVNITVTEAPNTPPTVSSISRNTNEQTTYKFVETDFDQGFSDPDNGDTLQKVMITQIPPDGKLELNGVAVVLNQEIDRANIAKLTYSPPNEITSGRREIGYKASDSKAYSTAVAFFRITIVSVNDAPGFTPGSDVTVDKNSGPYEQSWATFIFNEEADDDDEQTLTFHVSNDNEDLFAVQPDIGEATGNLTFTPATNATGSAKVTVYLKDDGGTANGGDDQSDSVTFTITVTEGVVVNQAPVAADAFVSTPEDTPLDIDLADYVSDDQTSDANLTYEIVDAPPSSEGTIEKEDNIVTFTPEENFAGETTFTYKVTDEGGLESETKTITINVASVEDAPVLDPIGNKIINRGGTLVFTATASDPENNILTFSLVGAPSGATIDPATGRFTWRLNDAQNKLNSFTFKVRVSDGTSFDEEQIIVTVVKKNTAPVLPNLGLRIVYYGDTETFKLTAKDADVPKDALTYSLINAPQGASIDPGTGILTWAVFPKQSQSRIPGSSIQFISFRVRVVDSGSPSLSDEKVLTFVVLRRVEFGVNATQFRVKADKQTKDVTLIYTVRNVSGKKFNNLVVQGDVFWPGPFSNVKLNPSSGTSATQTALSSSRKGIQWTIPSLPAFSSKTLVVKLSGVVPSSGAPYSSRIASEWLLSSTSGNAVPVANIPEVFLNASK